MKVPIQVRGKTEDDRAFLFKSWLRSYRNSCGWESNTVYYWHRHKLIEHLWDDPTAVWLVAVSPKDPTMIYGFLCGEATDAGYVVHYTFVRQVFRKVGIATALVCALQGQLEPDVEKLDTTTITHMTPAARAIIRGKYANLAIYNPYHAFYELPELWHVGG